MCQSLAAGGQRCAAHTRPGFHRALTALRDAENPKQRARLQVHHYEAVLDHAMTPTGAQEVTETAGDALAAGDRAIGEYLHDVAQFATVVRRDRDAIQAQVAATQATAQTAGQATDQATTGVSAQAEWDPGLPSVEVGEHFSIAEGGQRWHAGGCGAFAIAMKERWPHLKIATEMYSDHGSDSVAHAWAYDEATGHRFHIFGAEKWKPTTRPDYDPDSHTVLLDRSAEQVREAFGGRNVSEDTVMDAMDVACEMFDPDFEADDEYDRTHLYF